MRTLSAGGVTTLFGSKVPMILLIEMQLTPTLRLATSAVTISWNSQSWIGAGSLGNVEPLKDSAGEVEGLRFTLSGVPSENISLVLNQSVRNKLCILRAAILHPDTHVIQDVVTVGTFVLDQMVINGSVIGVTAYPMQRLFQRVKVIRYTDQDQQKLFPGDRCLEYIVTQAQHNDVWPAGSWRGVTKTGFRN